MAEELRRMRQRNDTAANWTSANPVLLDGEIGLVMDAAGQPMTMKIGDGATAFSTLPGYAMGARDLVLAGDFETSSALEVDVTDLKAPLAASATYLIELRGVWQTSLSTNGFAAPLKIPASAVISGHLKSNSNVATIQGIYQNADDAMSGFITAAAAADTDIPFGAFWIVKTDATAGDAQLRLRTEANGTAVRLKAGRTVFSWRRMA